MGRLLLGLVVVAGCGGGETSATEPVKVERNAELIDATERADVQAALQGTFSMPWWRGGAEQHPEVWSIAGGTLTRWDGSKEETATLEVLAPCLAKITWASGSFTYEEFVIDGETVWFGEEGGRTQGDRTVLCTSLGVYVLDAHGKCRVWEPGVFSSHPAGLNPRDTTCTIGATGLFESEKKKWQRRGDVFLRIDFEQRQPKPPARHASLADAKAALAR